MAEGRDSVFASELRAAMAKADVTQDQLAELLDVSRASVGNWVNGETMPTLRVATKICKTLSCSLDQLAGIA